MVVFDSIAERKASITVFTDIDCGFCRKLHQEVPSLNQMGVAVRYLLIQGLAWGLTALTRSCRLGARLTPSGH